MITCPICDNNHSTYDCPLLQRGQSGEQAWRNRIEWLLCVQADLLTTAREELRSIDGRLSYFENTDRRTGKPR